MKARTTQTKKAFPLHPAIEPDEPPQWLLQAVFDAHPSIGAILDESGIILFVNQAWRSQAGKCSLVFLDYGVGKSYLDVCSSVLGEGVSERSTIVTGLERVLARQQAEVCLELAYPNEAAQRWFQVRATRFDSSVNNSAFRVFVVHEEITLTKRMEEALTIKEETDRAVQSALDAKKRAEQRLQELSGRLINAQEQERRRVARELHDDLNQRMALLSIELEQLGQNFPRSAIQLRERTREIGARAQEISAEVHRISYQLHPSKLETLGLVAAVRSLCHDFAKHQVLDVAFTHRRIPGAVPNDVALCLFRVVQEALRNVIKHSGASTAKVELSGDAEALHLFISDSGAGFNVEGDKGKNGLGLVSMQERVRLLNGAFSVESKLEYGTSITARVPLTADGTATRN